MKTHLIASLLLSFASLALAQSDIIPLAKKRSDNVLIAGFASGAKTITISATGTLEFVSGATITGGSVLKAALALNNVENTALSTWAGSTNITTINPAQSISKLSNLTGNGFVKTSAADGTLIVDPNTYITSSTAIATFQAKYTNLDHFGNLADAVGFLFNNGTGTLSYVATVPVANGGTGQTSYTNGQILIGNTTGNTLTKATLTAGAGISITNGAGSITIATSGLVIGTNVQAYDADLTTWAGITPGANVGTFLGTPSSANLAAALTDETGTGKAVFATAPTFTSSVVVNKAGQSEAGGLEVADDVGNTSVRALYLLPPANNTRIYLGKPGQNVFAFDLSYCLYFTNVPTFSTLYGLTVGGVSNTYIMRSVDGGTEIGANHPAGYGLDLLQDNSFANGDITHLAMNVHRTNGTTIYGTVTTRTNYEGLNLSWDGTQYLIKPVAGSGGGTVRPVRYHTTGSVFFCSGSGSPESVVTAPVGSLYTRTDGGAGTTLYVKESGAGNTGWVAK